MSTITASILIGTPHPNHDGIEPSHYLFLSENSRPAWMLVTQNVYPNGAEKQAKITWIPTVEHMLEDAFLMVAVHVAKSPEIIALAQSYSGKADLLELDFYRDFSDEQRLQLYQRCSTLSGLPKLIVSVFRHSAIEPQLVVAQKYRMDIEICCVKYSRLYSGWTNEVSVEELKSANNPE